MDWDHIRAYSSRLAAWVAWLPDWLIGVGLIAAATLVALLLHRWAAAVVDRRIGSQQLFAASLMRQTRGPTRLAVVIAALSLTLQASHSIPCLRRF